LVPRVSSLSVPSFPFPSRLWLSSSSTFPSRCSRPFPPHEQWLVAVVGWCCWHWSSSSSSCWSLSSRGYGRRGPVAILVAPCFHPGEQLLAAAVGVLSQWWSPSYQRCCYGGGVCCPACPSSVVVVVLWWSCRPPLRSSPFCPTSVAHGRGGWCCVTWARSRSRPSPYRRCWPDRSRRLVVRVVMVAVVILVLVVVIVLRRLVSNNKMKREREKTYVRPKRRRRRLLGPFFCLPEGGSGSPSLGSVVLGVFSASPVHSRRRLLPPCCSLASLLRYVNH
jgi:hypothetical protein